MVDSFYTPSALASRLVKHVKALHINNVVDFCIGDGELIRAALKIWPNVKCFGTDISVNALKKVKKNHADWVLSKCDFLNEDSRKRCNVIKNNTNGFDLVLLNPPFSCIGGTIHEININGINFKVSTSMKFLAESLKYISNSGCLVAIMPISICYSQKDKKLWDYLVENYKLGILEIPNGNFFKKCSPSIVLVSININHFSSVSNSDVKVSLDYIDFDVFRGKVSVHDAKDDKRGNLFIHSTNIKNNSLEGLNIKVLNLSSTITGPAVLLPRVGKPDLKKICIIPINSRYTLSDCIIAIQTNNINDAKEIYAALISKWDFVKELYIGTGAKFITIDRLKNILGKTNLRNDNNSCRPSLLSCTSAKEIEPVLPNFNNEFSILQSNEHTTIQCFIKEKQFIDIQEHEVDNMVYE